ncbi:MAG TPA: L-threonylcarbamoyladenylate synthase [Bacteroidia bacterium]|jgi:tRNA threonylcarbamoyl adenosine modification protein (Sua5/YciO/YrdC/YwlC family)|nr:L-threonylcarbamoyladenylate synthase [Bacteroidia bacterium]
MHLRINPDKILIEDILKAVEILKNDGVIVYPTDSVYAMGCSSQSPKAIEKICRIKRTTPEKINLSLVCADLSQLSQYAKPLPNNTFRLMKKALPGPYTFILQAANNIPKMFLRQNKKTIGIRVPDNNICREIINQLGFPLVSTSLHNEDDEITEYFTDPEMIYSQYQSIADAVIDGGYGNLYTTTILDCTEDEPVVIREGLGSLDVLN